MAGCEVVSTFTIFPSTLTTYENIFVSLSSPVILDSNALNQSTTRSLMSTFLLETHTFPFYTLQNQSSNISSLIESPYISTENEKKRLQILINENKIEYLDLQSFAMEKYLHSLVNHLSTCGAIDKFDLYKSEDPSNSHTLSTNKIIKPNTTFYQESLFYLKILEQYRHG